MMRSIWDFYLTKRIAIRISIQDWRVGFWIGDYTWIQLPLIGICFYVRKINIYHLTEWGRFDPERRTDG